MASMLVVLSACSSETGPVDAPADGSDVSASPYPVPEEIDAPEQAVIAAYERYWRTVAEATTVPDPGYSALEEVASGTALETARSLAQAALDSGERDTGTPSHDAEVTESYPENDPYRFVVTDCMDSTEWIVLEASSGEPVEGEEYGTGLVEALVERSDGRWLVTEVVIQELGTCLGEPLRCRRQPPD